MVLPNYGILFLWAIVSVQASISASESENVLDYAKDTSSSWMQVINQNEDNSLGLADRHDQIVLGAPPRNIGKEDAVTTDMMQSSFKDDADVTAELSVPIEKSSAFVCPYELKSGDSYGTGARSLPAIYKILTTCSKTRVLHLTVQHGGCIVTDDPWYFEFSPGERFPPLEELRLDGYDLDGRRTAIRRQSQKADASGWRWYRNYLADVSGIASIRRIGRLEEDDPASIPTNLDLWRGAMDWTMLQCLEILEPSLLFVQDMAGQLPGLKSLKLGPTYIRCKKDLVASATTEFVMKSPRLEKLSLHGYTDLLDWDQIMGRHGATLQELTIREFESNDRFNPRPTFSASKIQDLKASCPNLTQLGLDINRNGTWPYPILDTLVTFPKIRALDLFFEIGEDLHTNDEHTYYWHPPEEVDDSAIRLPRVSSSSALHLFRHLRSRKTGVELERLAVHVGDWGRDYGTGAWFQGWGRGRQDRFVCDVKDEKGDRKLEGEAWCTYE